MLRATIVLALLLQPLLVLTGGVTPCADTAAPRPACCCAASCCPAEAVTVCGCADSQTPTAPAPAKESTNDLVLFAASRAIAIEPGTDAPPVATAAMRDTSRRTTHNERLALLGVWRT